MNSPTDSGRAAHNQKADSQAGMIISADGGALALAICVACRDRIAIPCQHYCTKCIPSGMAERS